MKTLLILSLMLFVTSSSAAGADDIFKSGKMRRIEDFSLTTNAFSANKILYQKIRVIESTGTREYYYAISLSENYQTKSAMISEDSLNEATNALYRLIVNAHDDKASFSNIKNKITERPDYIENVFITKEGLKVGYSVTHDGIVIWYIVLGTEISLMDNTAIFGTPSTIKNILEEAKSTISKLKEQKNEGGLPNQ